MRPQLPDDDSAQYEDILSRLKRLEASAGSLLDRFDPLDPQQFLAVGTGTITANGSGTAGGLTKFGYASEVYDPNSNYTLSPDYAYVAPFTGYYDFFASLPVPGASALAVNTRLVFSLYADAVLVRSLDIQWAQAFWSNDDYLKGNAIMVPISAGQKVDVRIVNASASTFSIGGSSSANCLFAGRRVA